MAGFSDLTGYNHIISGLRASIEGKTLNHAYIIEGEEGSGKKTLAGAFAMTLQCEEGGRDPCMKCLSCRQAMSNNHPDIITVVHEKTAVVSVDDIRKQVVRDIAIKPYSSRYKIYIIPEAEKMNIQAQNALLKTLEEPPAYGLILLLATNSSIFLETVRSRCSLLRLPPLRNETVKDYLLDRMSVDEYQAGLYTALARGNIGRARELIVDEDFHSIINGALKLLRNIKKAGFASMHGVIKEISEKKQNLEIFFEVCNLWYRDVLLYKSERDPERLSFKEELSSIKELALGSSYEELMEDTGCIRETQKKITSNVNTETCLELMLIKLRGGFV